MNKIVLIDGNAILYRAYHALPPLTAPDGIVVNAVYGFFSMLFKIIEQANPDYIAVCFDRAAPTFRQALYVGYHANRPKMPDDLIPQVGILHEILEKIGITIFEVDGYEADDLIGTLAYQAQNVEVIIVTGDRDLLQLVTPQVKLLMPITGISNMSIFDEKAVEEKYGVKPSQFIDYKALIGDPSDNYPGVAGIGPKTASTLLQKYQTFENLYQHLPELSQRIATCLATDAEQAALAKKLATIVTDAPITLDMAITDCSHINADTIKKEFEKLGFKSLQNRIPKQIISAKQDSPSKTKKVKDSGQLGLL